MSNAKGNESTKAPTIAELLARIEVLEEKVANIKVRDRGPKSTRSMTAEDAFEVKFGSLKDKSHMEAAKALGLAYSQVYSARGGYTFTYVDKDWSNEQEAAEGEEANS